MERRDDGGLTTGQRLERIEVRLDRLIAVQETKAEEADLRAVLARLELLEREGSANARRALELVTQNQARITKLETEQAVVSALRSNRRTFVGLVVAMAGWGGVLVAAVGLIAAHPWAH